VTVVDSTVVVVETGSHAREQSPNNNTVVVENMVGVTAMFSTTTVVLFGLCSLACEPVSITTTND